MQGGRWKVWVFVACVALHAVLLILVKMPEIRADFVPKRIILNLIEKTKPIMKEKVTEQPKPAPKKKEAKRIEKKIEAPPPPPPVQEEDTAADEGPIINPAPGAEGGVEGGEPGGEVGGETIEPAPSQAEPEPEPEPEPAVDKKAILNGYVAEVRGKVYGSKYYPEQARRLEHEGRVKVRFTVTASGSISSVSVSSSSGYSDLDNAALGAVRRASPFPAIPSGLEKNSLTMSITLKFFLS